VAGDDAIPPALLKVGVPVAGLVLVSLFVYLGFPYAALGERIADELKRSHGVRLEYGGIGPGFLFLVPAVVATDVRATLRDGAVLRLDEAKLRPALSPAWLGGDPALAFAIHAGEGSARGTFYGGDGAGLVGETHQLDLAGLPVGRYGPFSAVKGVFDATIDLRAGDEGLAGHLGFEGVKGSLDLVAFPVSIPFDAFSGDLVFGGGVTFSIERLALAGPVLNGTARGSAGRAAALSEAPLQLELEVTAKDAVVNTIRQSGVRVGRDGVVKARVTGTFAHPVVR
jgi:type II secretion system protein N